MVGLYSCMLTGDMTGSCVQHCRRAYWQNRVGLGSQVSQGGQCNVDHIPTEWCLIYKRIVAITIWPIHPGHEKGAFTMAWLIQLVQLNVFFFFFFGLVDPDPKNYPCHFLREVSEAIESNSDQGSLIQSFQPILQEVRLRLTAENMSIVHKDAIKYVKVLHFFTGTAALARVRNLFVQMFYFS